MTTNIATLHRPNNYTKYIAEMAVTQASPLRRSTDVDCGIIYLLRHRTSCSFGQFQTAAIWALAGFFAGLGKLEVSVWGFRPLAGPIKGAPMGVLGKSTQKPTNVLKIMHK